MGTASSARRRVASLGLAAVLVVVGILAVAYVAPPVVTGPAGHAAIAPAVTHPSAATTPRPAVSGTNAVTITWLTPFQTFLPNGTILVANVTFSGFAEVGSGYTLNITGNFTNATSHVSTEFVVASDVNVTATLTVANDFNVVVNGSGVGVFDWTHMVGNTIVTTLNWTNLNLQLANVSLAAELTNNTAGTLTNSYGTLGSPTFRVMTSTVVAASWYAPTFVPQSDNVSIAGVYYASSSPTTINANITVLNAPVTNSTQTVYANLTVSLQHWITFSSQVDINTYTVKDVPITAGAGTASVSVPIDMTSLSCASALACYDAYDTPIPWLFDIVANATFNITGYKTQTSVWTDASTLDAIYPLVYPTGPAEALGPFEILFGPNVGLTYVPGSNGVTPLLVYTVVPQAIPSNTTAPYVVSGDLISVGVPSGTPVGAWVDITNTVTGALLSTFSLNGTGTGQISDASANSTAPFTFLLNDTNLGCAATRCANVGNDLFNISVRATVGWTALTIGKVTFADTYFATIPVQVPIAWAGARTPLPPSSPIVGLGTVKFWSNYSGQYISAATLTIYTAGGPHTPIFSSNIASKETTWLAGSAGIFLVQVTVTTNYTLFNTFLNFSVVPYLGAVTINTSSYHNESLFGGLKPAVAGTILLLVGLIVGLIVALVLGRLIWGGQGPAAPPQAWQQAGGAGGAGGKEGGPSGPSGPAAANTCSVCGQSFATPEELAAHSKSEHGMS